MIEVKRKQTLLECILYPILFVFATSFDTHELIRKDNFEIKNSR